MLRQNDVNTKTDTADNKSDWVCATGNCFPDKSEQSKICIVKELKNNKWRHPKSVSLGYLNKLSHPKCVSLGYLNINYVILSASR